MIDSCSDPASSFTLTVVMMCDVGTPLIPVQLLTLMLVKNNNCDDGEDDKNDANDDNDCADGDNDNDENIENDIDDDCDDDYIINDDDDCSVDDTVGWVCFTGWLVPNAGRYVFVSHFTSLSNQINRGYHLLESL